MIATTETYAGLSSEDYHADHSRVSNSMLSVFRQSRQRYYRRFVAQTTPAPEPTPAMQLGSLVHTLVLEPEQASQYVVAPKCDRRTKEGKATYAAFCDGLEGRTVIDAEDYELAAKIAAAVLSNEVAANLLSRAHQREQSIYWTDQHTQLACKCRIDAKCSELLIDLKTTNDASPEGFASKCASLGYHRQAAWYSDGVEAATGERLPFVFIAVCSAEPFDVGIYELSKVALSLGAAQNASALATVKSCLKNDDWREPWQKRITELSLPKWSQYADEWSILE